MSSLISIDLYWANDTQGQTFLTPPCGWDIQASWWNLEPNKSIYSEPQLLFCKKWTKVLKVIYIEKVMKKNYRKSYIW